MASKQQMIDDVKKFGRESLSHIALGTVRAIIKGNYTDSEKVAKIEQVLLAFNEVRKDKSLPYTWEDARKTAATSSAE